MTNNIFVAIIMGIAITISSVLLGLEGFKYYSFVVLSAISLNFLYFHIKK